MTIRGSFKAPLLLDLDPENINEAVGRPPSFRTPEAVAHPEHQHVIRLEPVVLGEERPIHPTRLARQ
jgi:hypothetical protein